MAADDNRVYMIATLAFSILLIVTGVIIAFLTVRLRFLSMAKSNDDIVLGGIALLFVGAGIALTALANGLQARLMSEAAKLNHEKDKPSDQVEILTSKLLDAIADRLRSITIEGTGSLSSTNTTKTLNPVFKDQHDEEFKPEKDILGLKWKSDHPEFATVDDRGVVNRVNRGVATITVTFRSITSTACVVTCT
jgi:hypothetical protein